MPADRTCNCGLSVPHEPRSTGLYEPGKPAHHGFPSIKCPGIAAPPHDALAEARDRYVQALREGHPVASLIERHIEERAAADSVIAELRSLAAAPDAPERCCEAFVPCPDCPRTAEELAVSLGIAHPGPAPDGEVQHADCGCKLVTRKGSAFPDMVACADHAAGREPDGEVYGALADRLEERAASLLHYFPKNDTSKMMCDAAAALRTLQAKRTISLKRGVQESRLVKKPLTEVGLCAVCRTELCECDIPVIQPL